MKSDVGRQTLEFYITGLNFILRSEGCSGRYTLPTWADFEMGRYPVYWDTENGRPPTAVSNCNCQGLCTLVENVPVNDSCGALLMNTETIFYQLMTQI
jgi:hypothetical protein